MARDPAAVAQKWVQRMNASGQALIDGVNGVTQAPGAAAARQVNAYTTGVQQNAQKWATNVARVTLADWQNAMITKGAPRIGSGAAAAESKMANAMAQLLPAIDTIKASLPPRGDINANIARSVAFQTKMHQVQIRRS